MKRTFVLTPATVLVGLSLLISGVAIGAPMRGGTMKIAFPNNPAGLDPLIAGTNETPETMWHVYEGLFEPTKRMEVKPLLAKGYTVSSDGLRYTIELRQGILFHDGSEMTSEDVVSSLNRWFRVSNGGKEVAPYVKGVRAAGKYSVIVELQSVFGPFIDFLASWANSQKMVVLKREIAERFGDKPLTEHVGTGPYKFVNWVPNQYVELTRFDKYKPAEGPGDWHTGTKHAYVDGLVFAFVPDEATRVAGVQTGQYDYAQEISPDRYDQLVRTPDVKVYIVAPDIQLDLGFNRKKGRLFSDVNARRAMAAALNMKEILSSGYGDSRFWTLNPSWFSHRTIWYTLAGKDKYNTHDIEKAKKLLALAHYDGRPVELLGDLTPGNRGMALAIQSELKEIGMPIVLDLLERAAMNERRRGDNWDMHIFPIGANYPIPDIFSGWLGTNKWIGFWNDEYSHKMDEMFKDLATTRGQQARFHKFEKLQAFNWDVVPIITLGEAHRIQITSKRVHDFENMRWPVFFNVWLER